MAVFVLSFLRQLMIQLFQLVVGFLVPLSGPKNEGTGNSQMAPEAQSKLYENLNDEVGDPRTAQLPPK
ncbi:hypothetical protein AAVH_04132 [Aphelenchoides avenae]|nr:hypothetical protein AAVH_04132 [Aphelenchus avenae]